MLPLGGHFYSAGDNVNVRHFYPAIILALATLFFTYDIVSDLLEDSQSLFHILVESLFCLAISTVLLGELRRVNRLRVEVLRQRDMTSRLSGELLAVMRGQFTDWGCHHRKVRLHCY